ncbi:MAG: azurin [Pseudomonadota bacterium]
MRFKNKTLPALLSAAISAFIFSSTAQAAACSIDVEVSTGMMYSAKNIDVPKTCKDFTVNLKAAGTMPKAVMGHNLVVSKEADQKAVLEDGSKAGLAANYVKANDPRVLLATTIIGGGEKTSAKLDVKKLNAKDKYTFYCTFPGHAMMMKGTLKLI